MATLPFPGRISTLPTGLDHEIAIRLLRGAASQIHDKRYAFICMALSDQVVDSHSKQVRRTAELLSLVISARLEDHYTYGDWLHAYYPEVYHQAGEDWPSRWEMCRLARLAWLDDLINELEGE